MTRRREAHGLRGTRLYSIWKGMNQRCADPNHSSYHRYGGRGVTVCAEWYKFSAFYAWATSNGYDEGLTLDRVDGDGHYEPSNCRWATPKQQAANSSIPVLVEAFGETKSITEWASDSRATVDRRLLSHRLASGWSAERAITGSDGRASRPVESFSRGSAHPTARLTESDVRSIRAQWASGQTSRAALAKEFGVTSSNISFIVNGTTWTHLTEEDT